MRLAQHIGDDISEFWMGQFLEIRDDWIGVLVNGKPERLALEQLIMICAGSVCGKSDFLQMKGPIPVLCARLDVISRAISLMTVLDHPPSSCMRPGAGQTVRL